MIRRLFFWLHLTAGIVAGLIIALLCLTGAILAFEHELVAWSERDARQVEVPAGAKRIPLDLAVANVEKARSGEGKPSAITVSADPADAITVTYGREENFYVNPYSGEVRQPASTALHDFMHWTTDLHRWLTLSDESRETGKSITNAANLAFLFLALSGLYLWWPRHWLKPGARASLWFIGASGKARDWNWHNVIGFWSLPVIVVLTVSGAVIGYPWASDLVYKIAGEQPPPRQQGPGAAPAPSPGTPAPAANTARAATPTVEKPKADAKPLLLESLMDQAAQREPGYREITLRTRPQRRGGDAGAQERGTPPYTLQVKPASAWPATATVTYSVNQYTGAVLKKETFADQSPGRQARVWLRFLHTGQALGWVGQLVAGLACVGGLVLVYTGFALTFRRFFRRSAP